MVFSGQPHKLPKPVRFRPPQQKEKGHSRECPFLRQLIRCVVAVYPLIDVFASALLICVTMVFTLPVTSQCMNVVFGDSRIM